MFCRLILYLITRAHFVWANVNVVEKFKCRCQAVKKSPYKKISMRNSRDSLDNVPSIPTLTMRDMDEVVIDCASNYG